jgi:hypothetical protein
VAPPPQAPVKKWVVDFAEQQCMASRDMVAGQTPDARAEAFASGHVLQLTW